MAEGWEIRGEYAESCNCDYLCPCIYPNPQGEVTHDHGYAVLVFRIDRGQRAGVALDMEGLGNNGRFAPFAWSG